MKMRGSVSLLDQSAPGAKWREGRIRTENKPKVMKRLARGGYRGDLRMGVWRKVRLNYLCEYGTNWYCVLPEEPPRELAVACGGEDTKPFADEVVGAGLM